MVQSMRIGTKIRVLREIKGITPKDMAADLDMTTAGYLKIEKDEVDVNTDKIEKIATKLGIKPHELLSFDERIVFNNFSATEYYSAGINTVNNNFPPEMKSLYEDKIRLLEEKIEGLKASKDELNNRIEQLQKENDLLKSRIK